MNPKLTPALPWYRHRWPWLLMLGPFLVIVAAAITVWLALRSSDGLVADDYYKQGLAVNQVTSRDRNAAALELRGELSIDVVRQLVRVTLRSEKLSAMPEVLVLNFSHPTRSGLDQSLRLQRDDENVQGVRNYSAGIVGGGGGVKGVNGIPGRWHVTLEDERREWRLAGTWDVTKQAVLILSAQP